MTMRLGLFLCLVAAPVFAQEITVGADAAGRAGAGIATPQGDSALFVNPAGASLTPSLVTGFLYELQPKEGQTISLVAVDGTAPKVDGGVSATTFFSEDVTIIEQRSIASVQLGARSAFGLSQTYFYRDDLPKGERNFFSADAGLVLGAGSKLSFGAVITNFPNAREIDRRRELSGGAALIIKNFRFSAEGGVNLTPEEPHRFLGKGAVEWARFGKITLRGGYSYDANAGPEISDARQSAALGLTYHDQRSTLDIGYEQVLAGEGFSRLTIGIRFFLPGMNPTPAPNEAPKAAPNPSRFFGTGTGGTGSTGTGSK